MEPPRFRNSWYVATIITPAAPPPPDFKNPNKRPYYNRLLYEKITTVEYENLMEEDGVTKLRETIDVVQIRPIPPMEDRRKGKVEFKVSDDVDVWIYGGWWEGVIVKVLDEGERFDIYFRYSRKTLTFEADDLRTHREWVHGGDWVPPLLDEVCVHSSMILVLPFLFCCRLAVEEKIIDFGVFHLIMCV